ncbi:MAG: hypothetical protein IT352_12885 [Gemmatimonadales bacterium]|nr:hypothetical protein [Gemmatimonadales bacterium]
MLAFFPALVAALAFANAQPRVQLTCCFQITAIDTRTGLISATNSATGTSLQFQIRDRQVLARTRVQQRVYADLAARQVSLDGRVVCCSVIGTPRVVAATPPTAAPDRAEPPAASTDRAAPPAASTDRAVPPASTPAAADRTAPVSAVAIPALPQLSYGTPYQAPAGRVVSSARVQRRTVAATVAGRNQTAEIVSLRGRRGIEQATGLAPGIKNLLAMHVRTLPRGAPATYLVNTQLANEWITTHPGLAELEPIEPGSGGGDDCNGVISTNCIQQTIENGVEQAWDMTVAEFERFRERATKAWNDATGDLAEAWNTSVGCFEEKTLSLPNIPITFALNPTMTINLSQSGSRGSATGTLAGSVGLGVPMEGDFAARLDLFYIQCFPFVVRPKGLSAVGTMTVGEELTGTVSASGQFNKTFTIPPSGGPVIPIQVFPIMIGTVPVSEIDVSAYIEGNIEVSADGRADGRFQLRNLQPTEFQFACDGGGCRAAASRLPSPTTTSQGAQLEGRVTVKPAIYTALQLNFNYEALSARAGPQPYLLGVASGCGAVSATGTAASVEVQHALTGDLDWGVELRAEVLAMRQRIGDPFVTSVMRERHLWFRDLAPGGSTAFVPAVDGPPTVAASQSSSHRIRMPTCYPYKDKVRYQISWTGAPTPVPVPGCQWQAGGGVCQADPARDLVLRLVWGTTGANQISVRAVGDDHGRVFAPAPAPTVVTLTVGGAP